MFRVAIFEFEEGKMFIILISNRRFDIDGAILDLLSIYLLFNTLTVVKRT